MIHRLLRGVIGTKSETAIPESDAAMQVVMSVPHEHRDTFIPRVPAMKLTYDVLADLFRRARREIRIFSPYIDATFTSLAMMTGVPIRVLTTVRDGKPKALGVVERCASSRNLQVRYIHQKKQDAHLYQLHAKMVLVDGEAGYVGSANLTDASIHYNFELGFLVTEKSVVRSLATTFDYLFDQVGFPAKVR